MLLLPVGACALALLYFWMTGNWFARVVLFLMCAGVFAVLGGDAVAFYDQRFALIGVVGGGVAAWFFSGIPNFVARQKETRRDKSETFVIPYPR